MMDDTKTGCDRSAIFLPSCRTLSLLSEHVIGAVVPHYPEYLFAGQRFEFAIFQKFIRDYLAYNDRYGASYYCHYMGVI